MDALIEERKRSREAWRFFERLGLREEQLYIYVGHGDPTLDSKETSPIPSRKNEEVKALADRLNISRNRGDRTSLNRVVKKSRKKG